MTAFPHLDFRLEGPVAVLTLQHEETGNRLDHVFEESILRGLQRAAAEPSVRVVLLESALPDFCPGLSPAYLQNLQQYGLKENIQDCSFLTQLLLGIQRHKQPVVAAVQGAVYDEGLALTSVCDLVLAADDTRFALEAARYGDIPAVSLHFLLKRLPENTVRAMLFGSEATPPAQLQALGLVQQCFPAAELNAQALAVAQQMAERFTPGVGEFLKKTLADLPGLGAQEALAFAAKINAHARATDEYRKGLADRSAL